MKTNIYIFKISLFLLIAFFALHTTHAQSVAGNFLATTTKISKEKIVALTFDDGPYGSSTDAILNTLEKKKVKATFFLIGRNVEQHPEQARRMVRNGNVIANHSYEHLREIITIATSSLIDDTNRAQETIFKATGKYPTMYRAPYGAVNPAMVKTVNDLGLTYVGWNVDPNDWNDSNASSTIVLNVMKALMPSSVILLHDGHETDAVYSRENMVEALPTIIDNLKKEGYKFVTLDTLLGIKAYRK